MKTITLAELPPPPAGRTGWPWTEGSPELPAAPAGGWPRISIVTPSYNQGAYIEETIRSVLLQNYPDLEYFVLDGGSSDETVAALKKYSPWLTFWTSEKDNGQTGAINRGWGLATGELVAWINSDDWYLPGAFLAAAEAAGAAPGEDWFAGDVRDEQDGKPIVHVARATPLAKCLGVKEYGYHQQGMFWRRRLLEKIGFLDEAMHFAFDHEFWARSLIAGAALQPLGREVAYFRRHAASKTVSALPKFFRENWIVFERFREHLSQGEQKEAAAWLREYEAEGLIDVVYEQLEAGERGRRCEGFGRGGG